MGLFSKKKEETYCIFCGKDLADGRCSACGREAKPLIGLAELTYQQVPASAAAELGEQKKKLFGNPQYDVQQMIQNGQLFVADIYIDELYETTSYSSTDDDDDTEEESYYVEFSSADMRPCDRGCEIDYYGYERLAENLKNGQREAKLLKGTLKRKDYYYVFLPDERALTSMLKGRLAELFTSLGEWTEKRRIPPKGGWGNSKFDKAFDFVWDNTIGKL